MKKLLLSLFVVSMAGASAMAQPGAGFQRTTPEERAARVEQKLDSAFKLDKSKIKKLDTALVVLYKMQDTRMQELFQNSNGDRDAMRETMMTERKKFTDAEEEIIKAMLTDEQFAIWKDKILPSMRPQRPMGGGGGGGFRGGQQ
ncbi:MAG: hypothetical protein JST23_04450 [Bacteroidetes bacterium]|nr:hypothetical protein [Bacteroidota bacterium]